jgi:hypothetical protein
VIVASRLQRRIGRLPRPHLIDLAFGVVALVAFVYVLRLARHATFLDDDWLFIGSRELLSFDSWMRPHSEHWVWIPVLLFRGLFAVVGLHSYLPYLALLLGLHVIMAAGLYRLMALTVGRLEALAATAVLLVLGTAHENLFWAFQVTFIASAAAGLWALACLHGPGSVRRDAAAAVLLIVALASSGIGLPFLAAAIALVAAQPPRRTRVVAVGVPAAVYLGWFIAFGRSGLAADVADVVLVPGFVVEGSTRAIASFTGLGTEPARLFALVVAGLVALALVRGQATPPLAIAGVAGSVVLYGVIALTRGSGPLGVDMVNAPRYVTIGALFALLAAGALLGRATSDRARFGRLAVLAPVVAVALVANLTVLHEAASRYEHEAGRTRALVTAFETYEETPALRRMPGLPLPADQLRDLLDRHGSPVRDDLRPSVVPPIEPVDADAALVALVRASFTVEPVAIAAFGDDPPAMAGSYNALVEVDGPCLRLLALAEDSQVWASVDGGSAWIVDGTAAGDLGVYLSRAAPPQEENAIHRTGILGERVRIEVPDLGPTVRWELRLKLPAGSAGARWCSAAS